MNLHASKFQDPLITAKGERRAAVALKRLDTLWFNTGTLCNIECVNCYIESSPTNDRLAYLSTEEVVAFLNEAEALGQRPRAIGFTGGEPFMNPAIIAILEAALTRGFDVLVLTNAMKPMMRPRVHAGLLDLQRRHAAKLTMRVSVDHWRADLHDEERGAGSFAETIEGLKWLAAHGFRLAVAGRLRWGDKDAQMREGFALLFSEHGVDIETARADTLMLFPEMDARADVPEITEACWGILHKSPDDVMCASSRMVVKHKHAEAPSVIACTLLPYDKRFDLGPRLAGALGAVSLNHPHCAKFCVLGGGSCTA